MTKVSGQAAQRYAGFELRLVAFLLDMIVLFSIFMLTIAAAFLQVLLRSDLGEPADDPLDE